MTELVTVNQSQGPIAEVRLNRPDKKNAVTLELLDELVRVGEGLAEQSSLRAVVLAGAGQDFCAGMDTSVFMAMASELEQVKKEMTELPEGVTANRFQRPAKVWQDLPVPVIAAIEGVCLGAGIQIALACDFRIAAPDARLSILESKWGLIPDMGISLSLPRLMPVDRAKWMIMTGPMLSGEEALAEGLVTRVEAEPVKAAHALADELATKSPDAIRAGKALADGMWGRDPAALLALEARLQAEIIGGPHQIETVMARMQKRSPVYE